VEIIPRAGTFVSKPTQREIFELFTLKEVIEGLAAGLLAQRGAVPELVELEQTLAEMEAAVAAKDTDRYVEANDRFHDAIIRGSDNRKLQAHFHLLMNQVPYRRFVYLSLGQPHRPQDSLEEHRRVVAAIKTKDFHTAERETRRHVSASRYQLSLGVASKLMDQDPHEAQG
jgi:DNA-binding GntR family transcriptional regulator